MDKMMKQFAAMLHENNAALVEYIREEGDKTRTELMAHSENMICCLTGM